MISTEAKETTHLVTFCQHSLNRVYHRDHVKIITIHWCFSNNSYNGSLPQGDKGRRRSKFTLYKRQDANGVKPVKQHIVRNPQQSEVRN